MDDLIPSVDEATPNPNPANTTEERPAQDAAVDPDKLADFMFLFYDETTKQFLRRLREESAAVDARALERYVPADATPVNLLSQYIAELFDAHALSGLVTVEDWDGADAYERVMLPEFLKTLREKATALCAKWEAERRTEYLKLVEFAPYGSSIVLEIRGSQTGAGGTRETGTKPRGPPG